MKKLILLTTIMISGFLGYNANAQVSIKINIGEQPVWGPVGYEHVDYYYIPEIETYYYVPRHKFIYFEGNRWVSRSALPPRYYNYDLYRSDKVVINEPKPYLRHNEYRVKYVTYHGRHEQQIIRDSHDERYYVIKEHPEHSHWKEVKRHEKEERRANRHRDHDRGHERD